jgi:hypothetical protein
MIRLLVVAAMVAVYGANASALRPLYQLLANPGPYVQRAETLAQLVTRLESVTDLLRRP